MGLRQLFTSHPTAVGETYLQHLCAATGFAATMVFGGIACFLHALFPFAFVRTGSECITRLHERMVLKRSAMDRQPAAASNDSSHTIGHPAGHTAGNIARAAR